MSGASTMRAAAIAILVLNSYLQVVEWIDLYPWNDVRDGNGQEMLDIILAVYMAALAALLWIGWRPAAWIGVLSLAGWGWLQVQAWWVPYFNGASPGWERVYARWFAETTQWLPREPGRLPPDANHLVLQALIVVSLLACLAAAFSRTSAHKT